MKLRTLLLLAIASFACTFARAYSIKEAFEHVGAFDATGEFSLENVNGDVEIRTWDKNEISIRGEKSAKTEAELRQIEMTVDLTPSRAKVKVHLPKRKEGEGRGNTIRAEVRFVVQVPPGARIEQVNGVNSSITIEGIQGSVSAKTVNGGITGRSIGGPAKFSSVNGGIDVRFTKLGTQQALSFETVNGGIRVGLPKDSGAKVECSVVNGSINCDLPITLDGKKRGRQLHGTIGDGRASLEARSVNGGITINSV